ncbi:tRNA pseudouridine(38-40) synthase TruA [candidate division WOR-3 bacterium]|uniref:tRNA pseudouridine synthase A n=1 Tax=candidate division WOR-3 bacterium TaxID=2052148 RepID=A0A937XDM9_UNCW3|nr:tRNA pseudouridine(38-40) synthase TruA [candidate division WOR-3 bacterium]
MRNLKLIVEFDGTRYAGWQYQPRHQTVQGEIESAIGRIIQKKTTVYGCGRTDAGVSARAYVANVHIDSPLSLARLKLAVNHFLPEDILVLSVEEAQPGFHSRHSATGKTYVYHIVRRKSPLRRRFAWEFWTELDVAKMRRAASLFEGARDFRAFCQTRDENGTCHVRHVRVVPAADEVLVTVEGDRFLYKMVRRIVGALVACGSGRLTQKDIRAALAGKPFPPFQTAPACGLVLDSVRY